MGNTHEDDMRRLGEAIRLYRRRKGWSQGQLATYSGCAGSYISRIEAGERMSIGAEILGRIADALGVDVGELYRAAGFTRQNKTVRELAADVGVDVDYLEREATVDPIMREIMILLPDIAPDELEMVLLMLRGVVHRAKHQSMHPGARRSRSVDRPATTGDPPLFEMAS